MDRFKFRAWDKEKNILWYDIENCYDDWDCQNFYDYIAKDRYIVEQCTGLQDKNGKLIYEGDILKITDQGIDDIVKVYWENGMYCFSISPNSANLVFSDLSDNETTCEIIGNIHENADLLGEEQMLDLFFTLLFGHYLTKFEMFAENFIDNRLSEIPQNKNKNREYCFYD